MCRRWRRRSGAAWETGRTTGYAVHHVVCQTLVALLGTPHAETSAVLLPRSVELMASRAAGPVATVASALGGRPDDAPRLVADLAAQAGVTRLSELGVERTALADVARHASARPELGNAPEPPDERELAELLELAH